MNPRPSLQILQIWLKILRLWNVSKCPILPNLPLMSFRSEPDPHSFSLLCLRSRASAGQSAASRGRPTRLAESEPAPLGDGLDGAFSPMDCWEVFDPWTILNWKCPCLYHENPWDIVVIIINRVGFPADSPILTGWKMVKGHGWPDMALNERRLRPLFRSYGRILDLHRQDEHQKRDAA